MTNREMILNDLREYLDAATEIRVSGIRMAADPSMEGVFALRIDMPAEDGVAPADFLWTRDAGPTAMDRIEECRWSSFPPRAR